MTATVRVHVECDAPGCETWVDGALGHAAHRVREVLRAAGWTTAPEYSAAPDFCPAHRPKATP